MNYLEPLNLLLEPPESSRATRQDETGCQGGKDEPRFPAMGTNSLATSMLLQVHITKDPLRSTCKDGILWSVEVFWQMHSQV